MHLLWNIGGISTTVASVVCIVWLPLLTAPSPEEKKRMVFLLMVFAAASLGASLCPLIDLAIKFNPSSTILLIAFEGTALAYCGLLKVNHSSKNVFYILGYINSLDAWIFLDIRIFLPKKERLNSMDE